MYHGLLGWCKWSMWVDIANFTIAVNMSVDGSCLCTMLVRVSLSRLVLVVGFWCEDKVHVSPMMIRL